MKGVWVLADEDEWVFSGLVILYLRAHLYSSICCTNVSSAHMQKPLAQGT